MVKHTGCLVSCHLQPDGGSSDQDPCLIVDARSPWLYPRGVHAGRGAASPDHPKATRHPGLNFRTEHFRVTFLHSTSPEMALTCINSSTIAPRLHLTCLNFGLLTCNFADSESIGAFLPVG